MTDVREWLDSLGLGQYADAFERNDVDSELLPDLTDEDLEKLGIGSLGHRKKLLKAISSLATQGLSQPDTGGDSGASDREYGHVGQAERGCGLALLAISIDVDAAVCHAGCMATAAFLAPTFPLLASKLQARVFAATANAVEGQEHLLADVVRAAVHLGTAGLTPLRRLLA